MIFKNKEVMIYKINTKSQKLYFIKINKKNKNIINSI